jgi:uncharacterized membrane protein
MKVKKTTLLVIGAVLLWSVVAVWNGVHRNENKSTSISVKKVHSNEVHSGADRHTATNSSQRVNIATH